MNKEQIIGFCKKFGIRNVLHNSDGSISVRGNVDISNTRMKKIPVKFRTVSGYFNCCRCGLDTLENAPMKVGKSFFCAENNLENLNYMPLEIGNSLYCSDNNIPSTVSLKSKIGGRVYNYQSKKT